MVVMYAMGALLPEGRGDRAGEGRGSQAVTDQEFDTLLRSRTPDVVTLVGIVGLVALIYQMLFKPTFGSTAAPVPVPVASGSGTVGAVLQQTADALSFGTTTLRAQADTPFTITFDNPAPGVQHNVSIYRDSTAAESLYVGKVITGPQSIDYHVSALPAGSYFFRCDVHPQAMTGTLVVR
jgi:plastocyanin